MSCFRGFTAPVGHQMICVEWKPGGGKESNNETKHSDCSASRGKPSHLLLLCSSADVAGAPQVGRDQAIGRHGHSQGNQKLKKKHGEGDPGSGARWEANLTSLESSTSEDRLHFVVHCPRKREEEGESPDDGKSPVAISELSSYTQWCRNHLVSIHCDGCHGVRGDKHRDTLSERDEGAHKGTKRPVVNHDPDDGEGNIEGGHEKISKREISNEQVGYCVQPPCSYYDAKDEPVAKQGDDHDQAVDAHHQVVPRCEVILKKFAKDILEPFTIDKPMLIVHYRTSTVFFCSKTS